MPIQVRARRALLEAHLGRFPGLGSMCGSLELRELQSALLEVRLAVVAGVQPDQRKRHRYLLVLNIPGTAAFPGASRIGLAKHRLGGLSLGKRWRSIRSSGYSS